MSLPSAIKFGLLEASSGTFNIDALGAFFFQAERYFKLTGINNDYQGGKILALLMKGHALVWL